VNLFFSLSGATAFGRTRGNVLSVVYGHVGEAFYLRQLARSEQPGHPSIRLGPNIEWYTSSCERPSNTSPSVFSPPPVSKIIEGLYRRPPKATVAGGAPGRHRDGSTVSKSSRAANHSSRVPILCAVIALLSTSRNFPLVGLAIPSERRTLKNIKFSIARRQRRLAVHPVMR
jgi:hypothetical protein